jgi:AcrR family transcriptional regulator
MSFMTELSQGRSEGSVSHDILGRAAGGGGRPQKKEIEMKVAVGKRESHKQRTREALLRAAEQLFAERGYHATTVHAIAEAAGVTERTFFRYFASKADLVANDLNEWLGFFERALDETAPGLPALVAIEQAVQRALGQPGPVAGWLFPADSTGKAGPRPDGLSGVAERIAEIILRSRLVTGRIQVNEEAHPIAARRVQDTFRAAVLARTSVAIVRSAIVAATRSAALNGTTVSLDDIRGLISEGFALIAISSSSREPSTAMGARSPIF